MRSPLSHLTAVVWIAFPSHPLSCCSDAGYVGFVNSNFTTASLVLGEEVDFYSWQNTDAAGMEAIVWGSGDAMGNEGNKHC